MLIVSWSDKKRITVKNKYDLELELELSDMVEESSFPFDYILLIHFCISLN